jgi:hypothetical protein
MFRRLRVFMLVFAALLAAEPLLHNHPLGQIQDGSSSSAATCAICATGVGRLPIIASAVTAPRLVVYSLSVAPVSVIAVAFALPLASRAPPVF